MKYKHKDKDVWIPCQICGKEYKGLLSLTAHLRHHDDHPSVREYLEMFSINRYVKQKMERIFNVNYSINAITNCWEWIGQFGHDGYGEIYAYNSLKPAHRFSYENHHNCSILPGFLVCHQCDNTKCVNPTHLYIGTHQENMNDRKQRGRYTTGTNHHMKKSEMRNKLSQHFKGKLRPDLTGANNPMKRSEVRAKIKPGNSIKKPVCVYGVCYPSLSAAAKEIGVSVGTITRRVQTQMEGYNYIMSFGRQMNFSS